MARPALWAASLLVALSGHPAAAQCDAPIDLGRGEIGFHVPGSYDPAAPAPLVILLHGYGASGAVQEAYFRLAPLAEELGFLYAYPDGEVDANGNRYWNATDACCDFFQAGFDHSAYLRELVETVRGQCNVDPYRTVLVGHSNGGFMSFRMACDHADAVTGIASLAGATFADPAVCSPSAPVHVLQIHGTADTVIGYRGARLPGGAYPGAVETARIWAGYNGCSVAGETLPFGLDLDDSLPGPDSVARRWRDGCRPGGSVELWTIEEGRHLPAVSEGFRRGVIAHLLLHPRCRDSERLRPARCGRSGVLKLRLRRGVPGDRYSVRLSTDERIEGVLDARGRATVRLRDRPAGRATATVAWGCGATASRVYECR